MDDILALDLESVKQQLQSTQGDKLWSKEKCDKTEVKYKRFLALKRCFPHLHLVPSADVDAFWMAHTNAYEKYSKDSHLIFGYFLTAFQFFGISRNQEGVDLKACFKETKVLYRRFFNENYLGLRSQFLF